MKKSKKIAIAVVSAAAVILVAVIVAVSVLSSSFMKGSDEEKLAAMLRVMPTSVTLTIDDEELKVCRRANPDYNEATDELANKIQFYFTDKDGNEVVINGDDTFEYHGYEQPSPLGTFGLKTFEKLASVKAAVVKIVIAVAVLAVLGLIVLWFFKWSKAQDIEKEKKYAHKNANKSKKKKSKRK